MNEQWTCAVCGASATTNHHCIARMVVPCRCGLYILCDEPQACRGLAYWRINGYAECDECILGGIERLPDNREWLAPALADISQRQSEQRERRRLFIAAMRRAEMLWVRRAFCHLRDDKGIDWRSIQSIEIAKGYGGWAMITDCFVTVLSYPQHYSNIEDFVTLYHDRGDEVMIGR